MKNSIAELVQKIETEFDVNEIHVKKFGKTFEAYPWVKAALFHKFVIGKESLAQRSVKSLLDQFKSLLYGTWNLFLRKYEIWAFTTSVERVEINGAFTDKLFDKIASFTHGKVLIIEFRFFKKFPLRKITSKYVASKSLFLISEELYKRIFLRKKIEITHNAFIEGMEHTLQCKVNVEAIVKKNLAQYKMMKFWLKILPKPKYVFLSVAYNHFGYIRAFKESGIPVVEFQHGVIGGNHQAYNYAADMSPNQYPDALAVFGAYEKEYILKHSNIPIQMVSIIGRSITDHYLKLTTQRTKLECICVALQDGPIGDKAVQFLLDFNSISKHRYTFHLVPRRRSEFSYKEQFSFPDNFIFSKQNIYETVSKCDVHITAYSTVASEALSMGKRSILINIEGKAQEVFNSSLGSNPYVHFIEHIEQLSELLKTHQINSSSSEIAASNDKNIKTSYKRNCIALLEMLPNIKPQL